MHQSAVVRVTAEGCPILAHEGGSKVSAVSEVVSVFRAEGFLLTPMKLPKGIHVSVTSKQLDTNEINLVGRKVDGPRRVQTTNERFRAEGRLVLRKAGPRRSADDETKKYRQ